MPVSDASLGVEEVAADLQNGINVTAANGEIIVAGLGEASVVTVCNAAGSQVASVAVNTPEAVVAVPAAGLYIVAVTANGNITAAKVIVK